MPGIDVETEPVQKANLHLKTKLKPLWKPIKTRYVLLNGGRGGAKSFSITAWLADRLARETGRHALFTRFTMTAAEKSIVPEFMDKVERLALSEFRAVGRTVETPGGGLIRFEGIKTSSGNQTAKLKSIPKISIWICEEAEELDDEDTFDIIDQSIREDQFQNLVILVFNPTSIHHWIYQRFYKGQMPDGSDVPDDFAGVAGAATFIHMHWTDCRRHLAPSWIEAAERCKQFRPARYAWMYDGRWQQDTEGALWNHSLIQKAKSQRIDMSELVQIAVALDPSVTSDGDQDEVGLVCAGKTADGRYLVFSDRSGTMSVGEWADKAIIAYQQFQANAIVAEVNQGGDLVEKGIRNAAQALQRTDSTINPQSIRVCPVRASKGKLLRAEPIATLYEFGKVAHLPGLTKLETEMCTYTGKTGEPSPGRLDALVWALSWLSGSVYSRPKIRSL